MNDRVTYPVTVGDVTIGGDAPVVIQSMTNTDTADIAATVAQVLELVQAGSEIVRLTVNTAAAAEAVPEIRAKLHAAGVTVPLVGDFHFNGHRLLGDCAGCAKALDKYRINPGNVGFGQKRDRQFAEMVEVAGELEKAIRIGVNWGSLDRKVMATVMNENAQRSVPWSSQRVVEEALVRSVLESAEAALNLGLSKNQIVLSCKVSSVPMLISVYRTLADRCDLALHLGLTEAGMGSKGIVASSAALAVLLQEGIGDTIRISITPRPGESRTVEVDVAQQLLQSLELRTFLPSVTACPGCGRTTGAHFQELAEQVQIYLRQQMSRWRVSRPGVEHLKVAVMGCIVNGPGESKQADIGISLPGQGEEPAAPVYVDGRKIKTLRGDDLCEQFKEIIEQYVNETYRA